ncbi:hypothetical protein FSW04_20880 [Baekduia soli]|uniref:HIRAN domain-containing protein n=1 Tax=Baekduia soli TaxID=496014 RepID=A0A5B8UAT4_9ACTN|nr:HIRAN domain-containing protein [Baekduia soli]QEC49782.1 hypothetical protein FSW04_20880 [Baekduia soli]
MVPGTPWPPAGTRELPPDGYRAVVGESFHQEALAATAPLCVPGEEGRPMFRAVLIAEPDNPYDPNAVAIHSAAGKVGHLSRADAVDYVPVLAALAERGLRAGGCHAFLNGGPRDRTYGVVLRLSPAPDCLLDVLAGG